MKVSVAELRAIADCLFAHLEETGRLEIEIIEDYYWMISQEEVYDPGKDPADITVGQLTDDWSELRAILEGERPPIGHGLVWLAAILRIVGEKSVY